MSADRTLPRPSPASPGDLLDRPVHVTVRDYPETLAVLRRRRVDLGATGGLPLRSLEDADALAALLMEATGWRTRSAGREAR